MTMVTDQFLERRTFEMSNELIHSDEIADTYKTNLGIITVWKKDGKDQNGVNGKAGTSVMAHTTPTRKMKLKKKYRRQS
jgi:hypothetical protein